MKRSLVLRVTAGTAASLVMLAVLGLFSGSAIPSDAGNGVLARSGRLPDVPPAPSSVGPPESMELLEGESRTALHGDEVSEALATYGIDGAGNLYEVHSPQTEVPKLGRPIS